MMELVDTAPAIDVAPAEYGRLLGFPRGHTLEGRAAELGAWARDWYAQHGRPWFYARQCGSLRIAHGEVVLEGDVFASGRLQRTLAAAEANGAFVVAVSAGLEAETHAQALWREEKPDEYFFLEVYASAVVEHLVTRAAARLCAWADSQALAVLPHDSPGYPEWDITEQPRLLALIRRGAQHPLPGPLESLDTGMLKPKKSLLAVFGLTSHVQRTQHLTGLIPCNHCSLASCAYRRAPYLSIQAADAEVAAVSVGGREGETQAGPASFGLNARYSINPRALQRWAEERLILAPQSDGTIEARFRYDGTTCSNMGRPLAYEYLIKLGPRAAGYPLQEMTCAPATGDDGYKYMCRYISHREMLTAAIAQEKPLLGQPLSDVLTWPRPSSPAGCYCDASSREHKWGLVLETIHFALAGRESSAPGG